MHQMEAMQEVEAQLDQIGRIGRDLLEAPNVRKDNWMESYRQVID